MTKYEDQKNMENLRLAAIVESSSDAIIGKTLDGIITSWNKAAEIIYGFTAEEVIGRSISVLIPSEREDEMPQILEKIRAGEQIKHFETARKRKDGQLIFMPAVCLE
jgi:PAS domain S-box-containing protein